MIIDRLLGLDASARHSPEDYWIPLADVMTALMMMFLLIAVIFMIKVQADAERVDRIAILYNQLRTDVYKDLDREFHKDLPGWSASLDHNLTIRFKEPDVLFDTGRDALKPRFAVILDNFFPRYVRVLSQSKYRDSIEEIRIEGHTSSFWAANVSAEDAYFLNMALSQARTRSTLKYVLSLPAVANQRTWLTSHLTANGLSSSKLIRGPDGREDPEASQRVEFRVRTNADARISDMIGVVQK